MDNMARKQVWQLVPRAEANGRVMGGRWVLKDKPDGNVKAR